MSNENAVFILNLLQNGLDSSKDLQLTALEQLCLFILQIDSSEVLKKEYPPSSFIPVLVKLFVEFDSPAAILESASRVLTYYTQILPLETASSLFEIEGSMCAICIHLESSDLTAPVENDLAQQIVKLLEELVRRDLNVHKIMGCTSSVFEFLTNAWKIIHLDTLRSGLYVAGRLSNFMDLWLKDECPSLTTNWKPTSSSPPILSCLQRWVSNLFQLITHRDLQVTCGALECLHCIFTAFRRLPNSAIIIEQLASKDNLVEKFLSLLAPQERVWKKLESNDNPVTTKQILKSEATSDEETNQLEIESTHNQPASVSHEGTYLSGQLAVVVVELILNLCRGQSGLLSAISISPNLINLFHYALSTSDTGRKISMGKANSLDMSHDILLPTLHLADGLLNLSMSMLITENDSVLDEAQIAPNINISSPSNSGTLENDRLGGISSRNSQTEQNQMTHPRKHWKTCITARLFSPKPLEPQISQNRCGLPTLPTYSSSSSTSSTGSQTNLSIASGIFLAARQAFDQMGIADDPRVAMDRFHLWLTRSLASRASMGDVISILQSAQINCNWIDACGQPVLASALATGNSSAVIALCNRGLDVNAGLIGSAIHYAAAYGQLQIARHLLGLTPYSQKYKTENSISNPRLRDLYGRTPAQIALHALNNAHERGISTNRYRKLSKLLLHAEERFKKDLTVAQDTPFAKLLRCSLPVLTEVYLTTTKPGIRIRALQIICRSIRSKTGFSVLYQMQKPCENQAEAELNETICSSGATFCDKFIRMLASVLGQGSSEEVFLAMTMIPALLDLPHFLTSMHRYGIPQLLVWRGSLYNREADVSLDQSSGSDSEKTEPSSGGEKGFLNETVHMCLPSFVKEPVIIPIEPREIFPHSQCLHELSYYQAYTIGDWCLMRSGPKSLLLFHEFAFVWVEVDYQLLRQHENVASSSTNRCELLVFLVTRKDKGSKPEFPGVPLSSTDRNPLVPPTAANKTRELRSMPFIYSISSESANGLNVLQIQFDSPPTDRSELASELWSKAYPLIVKIRHMFYGMLPLPLGKSASPLRPVSANMKRVDKGKKFDLCRKSGKEQTPSMLLLQSAFNASVEGTPGATVPCFTINRLCATASSNEPFHSEEEPIETTSTILSDTLLPPNVGTQNPLLPINDWNSLSPEMLQPRLPLNESGSSKTIEPSNSSRGLTEESTDDQECLANSPGNNQQLPTFKESTLPLIIKAHSNSEAGNSRSPLESPMQRPLLTVSSLDNTRVNDLEELNGTARIKSDNSLAPLIDSQDANKTNLSMFGANEETCMDKNSIYLSAENTGETGCVSTVTINPKESHSGSFLTVSSTLSSECGAACEIQTQRNSVNASKRLTTLYVDAIRISLSQQGLWFILDPTPEHTVNKTTINVDEKHEITVCNHPECQGKWNPDSSDDEMSYDEPILFSSKELANCEQTVSFKQEEACSMWSRDLRKIFNNITPRNYSSDFLVKHPPEKVEYKVSRLLCLPNRLGGIRSYGQSTQPVYQSGPLTRSSGNIRLTKCVENLNFNQRQYVRTKHREARLKNVRRTISRVAVVLSDLLMRLMEKKRRSMKGKPTSLALKDQTLQFQLVLANELSRYALWLENNISSNLPVNCDQHEGNETESRQSLVGQLVRCIDRSTPYEILTSQLISSLWNWLKKMTDHVQQTQSLLTTSSLVQDTDQFGEMWSLSNLEILIKRLVATLEFIERYPTPVTQFVAVPEQLLTRTVQIRPQLVNRISKLNTTSGSSIAKFSRKVDLSHHHLYVQPLVTVGQLQEWVVNSANKIPWYNDELKHMGFVHDMNQPPHRVYLVPPKHLLDSSQPSSSIDLKMAPNVFEGGVFEWLSSNGGREVKRANPLRLHGLVRMMSSDVKLNQKPLILGALLMGPLRRYETGKHVAESKELQVGVSSKSDHKTHAHQTYSKSVSSRLGLGLCIRASNLSCFSHEKTAWIAFDLGMHLKLTHYLIEVPLRSNHWPRLFNWQLQGSNNGITWTTVSEHHIKPFGDPTEFWGCNGEKLWPISSTSTDSTNGPKTWRFLRLVLLKMDCKNSVEAQEHLLSQRQICTSFELRSIEFFGTVEKLCISHDKDALSSATSYLNEFKPGTYVVPNVPIAMCDMELSPFGSPLLCEHWPFDQTKECRSTEQKLFTFETSTASKAMDSSSLNGLPLLGRVVSALNESGSIEVQWLSSPENGFFETSKLDSTSEQTVRHCMGAENRFELRIPSSEELHLRRQLLQRKQEIKRINTAAAVCEKTSNDAEYEQQAKNAKSMRPVPSVEETTNQDLALVSSQPSLVSYLFPITPNWLCEALLPTINRLMPLLFYGTSPRVLREPSILHSQVSTAHPTLSFIQASQAQPAGIESTASSNWEDAHSTVVVEAHEIIDDTTRSTHNRITSELCNSDGQEIEPNERNPNQLAVSQVSRISSVNPIYLPGASNQQTVAVNVTAQSSDQQNPISILSSCTANEKQVIPVSHLLLSSDEIVDQYTTDFTTDKDPDVPWAVTMAQSELDSHDDDDPEIADTDENVKEDEMEGEVGPSDNLDDACPIFAGFRALAAVARPEEEIDAELEAIGRTLELRIIANASELGIDAPLPSQSARSVRKQTTKTTRCKRYKFDQWEQEDPIDVDMTVKQCMHISVLSSDLVSELGQTHETSFTTFAKETNVCENESKPQLLLPHASSPSIPASQNIDDPWRFLFDSTFGVTDGSSKPSANNQQMGPSFLSPPSVPTGLRALRDKHHMLPNRPTNKPLVRSKRTETMKVENIEAQLGGLIPPFEIRAGAVQQPSTATFTIPNRVPWPPLAWSHDQMTSLLNKHEPQPSLTCEASTTAVNLWLHREPSMDMSILSLSTSSQSTLSPSLSGTTSSCTSQGMCPENPAVISESMISGSKQLQYPPETEVEQLKSSLYFLRQPNVHLLRYLLDSADYTEEFVGSGVLKPAKTQLGRLWNHTYLLDYTLEEADAQVNIPQMEPSMDDLIENCTADNGQTSKYPPFADPSLHEKLLDVLAMLYDLIFVSSGCSQRTQLQNQLGGSNVLPRKQTKLVATTCSLPQCIGNIDQEEAEFEHEGLITAFRSPRITRKLFLFSHDVWSVLGNIGAVCTKKPENDLTPFSKWNSAWITPFISKFKFLLPFEVRLEFWRVSSLGTSRAIAWLQKQVGHSRVASNNLIPNGANSLLQRLEANLNSRDRQNGKLFGSAVSFSWTPSILVHKNSGITPNSYGASLNFTSQPSLTSLGRLQRHMARVPRPQKALESDCFNSAEVLCTPFLGGVNTFWCATVRLLLAHADLQQELEVEFEGEEGTGLGPTMEFYALLSAELRRHRHGLWVSEDRARASTPDSEWLLCKTIENDADIYCSHDQYNTTHTDVTTPEFCYEQEEDFYVNPPMGLFPAPWPEEQLPPGAELRFYILGVAVAKCLADQRQMDLPLSIPLLYLLTDFGMHRKHSHGPSGKDEVWPSNVLVMRHFTEIYPERGKFIMDLLTYLRERKEIKYEVDSVEFQTSDLELQQRLFSTELASLCISMSFTSVTKQFGQSEFPLTSRYDNRNQQSQKTEDASYLSNDDEQLSTCNVEAYVRRSLQFALVDGIRRQMNAFRAGFERVIPLESLSIFTPRELGRMISGESIPEWNAQELWTHCEPAAGYTRRSKGFLMLIEALAGFDTIERRAFLRFVTGCPTLPPGGLRNLYPKIKVAKKDGATCGPFPSVNTCMHYLKLPEYGNVFELKKYLLAAASQKGFYLN